MIASTTTTTNYHGGIHWPDIHFFDSLPVSDDDGDVCGPPAKKAKVPGGGHGAVRRHQNRVAARRSRQKKKQEEAELQQNLAFYTKSNEALKKENRELEHMLDMARIQAANMSSGEVRAHRVLPSTTRVVDPLFDLPLVEIEPSHVGRDTAIDPSTAEVKPVIVPESNGTDTLLTDRVTDFIDVLLEDKEWLVATHEEEKEVAEEVTDEEDHLDILFEDDSWLNDAPATGVETAHVISSSPVSVPVVAPAPVVSPVVSFSKAPVVVNPNILRAPQRRVAAAPKFESKTALREYHLEKNRVAARNRRQRMKMEHQHLQQSVTAYTQSNEMLKKKNRELEILLLQARNQVAADTSGEFVHYTTVFGAIPSQNECCSGVHKSSADAHTTGHKRSSSGIELPLSILDGVVAEAHDDDDHDLSFLWA